MEERPAVKAWLEVQEREAEPEPAYCPACRQARFWVSVHGAVVCGICHPPASPRLVERWPSTLDGSGSISPAEIAPTLNSQGGPPSLAEVEAMLPAGLRVLSYEPKLAPLVVSPVLTLTEVGRFFRRYLQDLAWRVAHADTAAVAPLADILGKLRAAGLDLISDTDLPSDGEGVDGGRMKKKYLRLDLQTGRSLLEDTPDESAAVCDFCSGPSSPGKRVYATREHELAPIFRGIQIISEPGWAACGACAALIDAESWKTLADRCVEVHRRYKRYRRMPRSMLGWCIQEGQRRFRAARLADLPGVQ